MRRLMKSFAQALRDENVDLYILVFTALVFTVLGAVNISSTTTLSSVTLGALAFLAFSQIRSRRHVAEIARSREADPLAILRTEFPADLAQRRASATQYLYIGVSMARTVQTMRNDLRRLLLNGAKVRVLLLDPTDDALLRHAAARAERGSDPRRLAARINASLEEIAFLRDETRGDVEIRVLRHVPSMSVNAIDTQSPAGTICVQHYEYHAPAESLPVIQFESNDGFWYQHFVLEAERMWEDGNPWPPLAGPQPTHAQRPQFKEEFDGELITAMESADELLITGATRNTLVHNNYGNFEKWLTKGCRIRFLLIDPESDAVTTAADRYYAGRSPENLRERGRNTLRLLRELRLSTGGDLTVRLTSHPLAMGMVAVDASVSTRGEMSALFMEYFTYQASGEPKFVVPSSDERWFVHFVEEAEALWRTASDHEPEPAE
ncbi:DUF5919 domain-containing protein [Planotetraspora kaengkrachanensis]|uniref:DUF5919 domain-containing protein n=1 Tax=Planotetraspora kaengkrachanensis TaxID=575193 RepID=A0A8J3PTU1_9ACTN|nr:DUF5919 domain-containing protein [Planotetraspora kaengkrachanensis]GIG80916.1 hypothetical protein Pka01_40430 [Planotetraspora kaengkrachanensis]